MRRFDPERVRGDVPELRRTVHGREMAYLDSAASSLTPRSVIEAMSRYYERTHTNVHRGVYEIAEEATEAYEHARKAVGRFIGAPDPEHEIVFTKNATESFNLFARSWGTTTLAEGDVVVLTEMEHHANLVPWLQLKRGARASSCATCPHRRVPAGPARPRRGARRRQAACRSRRMSNVLGTIPPLARLAGAAHAAGALIAIDAAQLVGHAPMDVAALGVDVACFSAHKMLGPTGIGVLWARAELLEAMPPFLGGGGMILDVRLDWFRPAEVPHRFEAGTPPIAEAVGLTAAVRYLEALGHGGRAGARPRAHRATRSSGSARGSGTRSRVFGPSGPRGREAASCRSSCRGCTPTTSPRCSTSTACASGPATTARSRSCAGSACRRPPASASVRTPWSATSTRSWTGSTTRSGCSAVRWTTSRTSIARSSSTTTGRPRNRGELPTRHPRTAPRASIPCAATRSSSPMVVEDGTISDIKIAGHGCSISQSSASLMSGAVKGKTSRTTRARRCGRSSA